MRILRMSENLKIALLGGCVVALCLVFGFFIGRASTDLTKFDKELKVYKEKPIVYNVYTCTGDTVEVTEPFMGR